MLRETPGHGWHCIRATRSEWPGFNSNHEIKSMNQNIELLKLRLEIAELREKEAVRNTTAARAALLLALDGIVEQRATPPYYTIPTGTTSQNRHSSGGLE